MKAEEIKALAVQAEKANRQRDYDLFNHLMRGLSREDRRALDVEIRAITTSIRELNPPHYFR